MENTNPKYLVTGATGYIGSVLVRKLREQGHDVTSLALSGEDCSYIARYSAVRFADVCDSAALEREASGFDTVIHLAGIVDVGTGSRALMKRVNIGGTRNIAELCLKHRMKMLHCSSVHAIPCLKKSEVMAETDTFDPRKVKGAYAKTKAEATRVVLEAVRRGLDAMIAFPSGIIGPYERKMSNIGQLVSDFLCGRLKARVQGRYNFVDVRDVAGGISGMLEHWKTGESYLLSGNEVTVDQLLDLIASSGGLKKPRVCLPYWFALAVSFFSEAYYYVQGKKPLFSHYALQTLRSNCRFSNRKASAELGFHARAPEESLSGMTQWIRAHFVENRNGGLKPCPFRE